MLIRSIRGIGFACGNMEKSGEEESGIGRKRGNRTFREVFRSSDLSTLRVNGRKSILEAGELFKDSPLNEFYSLQEEESGSVMLLNGKSPTFVPSLKAAFDPNLRPTEGNYPSISGTNSPFQGGDFQPSPRPLHTSTQFVPILHSPGSSRLRGDRKLRKSEDLLPAIPEAPPLQYSPYNRRNSPKRPVLRKQRDSIARPQTLVADSEMMREQQELEASIRQLNQLLSRVRKQPLGSSSLSPSQRHRP